MRRRCPAWADAHPRLSAINQAWLACTLTAIDLIAWETRAPSLTKHEPSHIMLTFWVFPTFPRDDQWITTSGKRSTAS